MSVKDKGIQGWRDSYWTHLQLPDSTVTIHPSIFNLFVKLPCFCAHTNIYPLFVHHWGINNWQINGYSYTEIHKIPVSYQLLVNIGDFLYLWQLILDIYCSCSRLLFAFRLHMLSFKPHSKLISMIYIIITELEWNTLQASEHKISLQYIKAILLFGQIKILFVHVVMPKFTFNIYSVENYWFLFLFFLLLFI